MFYAVIADGTKIHVTNDKDLAETLQQEFENSGYGNSEIAEFQNDLIHLYLTRSVLQKKWVEFNPGINFKIPLKDWELFKGSLNRWDKKQKSRECSYFKLYGRTHIICLTPEQRNKLSWEIIQKTEDFDPLYMEEVNGN